MRQLLIAAAGTGGHVLPGLAVAARLRGRGWGVSWLGTHAGMERALVERDGVAFDAIDFSGIRGKGARRLIVGAIHLLRAIAQSRKIIRARRPRAVFTTGGYVAVPAGLAARSLGVPLVLLNADVAPLLSTRLLRPFAARVLCGFDGAARELAAARGEVTGNPVRAEIAALPAPAARYVERSGPLSLLVLGGSLGAQVLNEVLPAALARQPRATRPRVVHQCGATQVAATQARYETAGVAAEVIGFIDDIAARYHAADVVLCRAGAITVAELTVAGVAAILVPLLARTTTQQRSNALFLVAHDAAIHLPQSELTAERLANTLSSLTRGQLQQMAQAAHTLARPQATAAVVDAIERIAA